MHTRISQIKCSWKISSSSYNASISTVGDAGSDSEVADKGELFSTSREGDDRVTVVDVPIHRPTGVSDKQRPEGLGFSVSLQPS